MDSSRQDDATEYAILEATGGGDSPTPIEHSAVHSSAEDALALLPESTVGHVQVVRLIGCGKVSESWFGVDAVNQREVVVKVLRKPWSNDPRVLAYFERQLQAIAALKHINLASILDVGREGDVLFWVTEWVKGGSVWPKVRRKGPMDIQLALNVIDQACTGLAHGAVANLVHGGLKPENILMERSGSVKVSDLGIEFAARQLVSGTPSASALWIAEFMAPEVRSGAIPDVRSDVFSLGAILLYLVAGVVPHDGMLDATSPRITPALRHLLIGMTAPKAADRISDYGELRAAIADAEAGNTGVRRALPSNWQSDSTHDGEVVPLFAADTVILDDTNEIVRDIEVENAADEVTVPPASSASAVDSARNIKLAVVSESIILDVPGRPHRPPRNDAIHIAAAAPSELRIRTPERSSSRPAKGKAMRFASAAAVILAVAAAGAWYLTRTQIAVSAPSDSPPAKTSAVADTSVPTANPASPSEPMTAAAAASHPTVAASTQDSAPPPPLSVLPGATVQVPASTGGPSGNAMPLSNPAPVGSAPSQPPAIELPPIIVDNAVTGAIELDPPAGWRASSETRASYAGSSLVAQAGGPARKATFFGDIPREGRYQLYAWWVARAGDVRSAFVPTTVFTASGPINIQVDQVNSESDFNLVGTYYFKAGTHLPIISISTEGVPNPSGTVHVSVDALKLVFTPN